MDIDKIINENLADTLVGEALKNELNRQNNGIELIASENYPSSKARLAMASIATAKYAEGYPEKRYYGGCKFIDEIENAAISTACRLFNCKYANVQPHSGSQANAQAYRALEKLLQNSGKLGDQNSFRKMKVLSTNLNFGAHLTHGSSVSFSSNTYDFDFFDLDETGRINFDIIEQKIKEFRPDVLLTGYSAYPYSIDFASFKRLADKYGILLMVDMAHIAGLVACGEHQSPLPYADIVTTTTHKTLRGVRGGLILTNRDDLIKLINSAVFPYSQGGPLENVIAGKAICFEEALKPEFKEYIKQVKLNTKTFAETLSSLGAKCSKTDNHLMFVDVKTSYGLTGLDAQKLLEEYDIITNKNMIPNDTEKPNKTSGLRIGFAALTTRGCTPQMAKDLACIINDILLNQNMDGIKNRILSINSQLKRIEEL